MMLTYLLGHRFSQGKSAHGVGRLLGLSVTGAGISLFVVLMALSIILGFKEHVNAFAYSQTGHISLYPYGDSWTTTSRAVRYTPELAEYLQSQPEIKAHYPVVQQMALLKTEDNFAGLMLYGVDASFEHPFFAEMMTEGNLSQLRDQARSGAPPIILSNVLVKKLNLRLNDKVRLYFLDDNMRVRAFTLVGIYETSGLERMPALCSASVLQRLHQDSPQSYSRILITLKADDDKASMVTTLANRMGMQSKINMDGYGLSTAEELMPELFTWLSLLDSNVIFLIVVMLIIGIFTVITGVIILVLDKTAQIGILKAIGADDAFIRKVFFFLAARIMILGLLIGNVLAAIAIYMQDHWQIIKLNPRDYYMNVVPVAFDWMVWFSVNAGALGLIALVVLVQTRMAAKVSPAEVMRFE